MNPSAIRIVGGIFVLGLYGVVFGSARADSRGDAVDSVERLVEASRASFDAGRYQEALTPTLELTRALPGQHVYAERLARIYRHLDRCQDEAAAWEQVITTSPTPVDACPSLPDAYKCAGQAARSLDALERCSAFDPTNSELLFHLGHAHERTGRFDLAEAAYREAIARDGRHADSLLGLGRLHLHAGRVAEAAGVAASVLASNPNHADALLLAGSAAHRHGRTSDARGHLERALQVAAGYVDVHIELGRVEISSGRHSVARRHFDRAVQLDPGRQGELAALFARSTATP